jgi:hypothetical protein
VAALLAGGCGSKRGTQQSAPIATGPPNVVRVALGSFRWPLDPALADGRDETTLARALYATPLRTDPATGAVVPGLCSAWKASPDFRDWTFTCGSAPSIAAGLRRLVRLKDAPSRWLFADATKISADSPTRLRISLRFGWRRFPYAMTAVAAAPRFVPGPFRLVSGSANRVVLRNAGLTVIFRRLGPYAAARAFRAGEVDEAPVPLGDVVADRSDPALRSSVRTRRLLGLDLVAFRRVNTTLRRVYWQTADRTDYEQLIPEEDGASAYAVVGAGPGADPAAYRRAVHDIPSLPRVLVRIAVPPDPALRDGALLLYANWRDLGLGPQLVSESSNAEASFERLLAVYPQEEAIPAMLALRDGLGARAEVEHALAATEQKTALQQLDDGLRNSAAVIPIAWVVDARLVSTRLQGWREDVLGTVDYRSVISQAASRGP